MLQEAQHKSKCLIWLPLHWSIHSLQAMPVKCPPKGSFKTLFLDAVALAIPDLAYSFGSKQEEQGWWEENFFNKTQIPPCLPFCLLWKHRAALDLWWTCLRTPGAMRWACGESSLTFIKMPSHQDCNKQFAILKVCHSAHKPARPIHCRTDLCGTHSLQ